MFGHNPLLWARKHHGIYGLYHAARKKRERLIPFYRRNFCLNSEAGNIYLRGLLAMPHPVLVGRLGGTEAAALSVFLTRKKGESYPSWLVAELSHSSGMFSGSEEHIDEFCRLLIQALDRVHALGAWQPAGEAVALPRCCPQEPVLLPLHCFHAWAFGNPWTQMLAGKRVLVVSPFKTSIERNYSEQRKLLFHNTKVLPDFDLQVVRAVQGLTGRETGYETWFDALDSMKQEISRHEFDVALLGCGAYGLPLAAWLFENGHSAVHLAGMTQLFFGVLGRRWATAMKPWARLEHWSRPLPEERPERYLTMENGCYW